MELFDFDYHKTTTEYPDHARVQLGNSYTFAPEPAYPDQRKVTLHFPAMYYFRTYPSGELSETIKPGINFLRLEKFYQRHRMWKKFNYEHPVYGMGVYMFNKPLQTPKPIDGALGLLEGFTVELLEQP